MAVYGVTVYGTETYGYSVPPQYRVDPFIAEPHDYGSISISWAQPTGTILAWRIVKNMYGLPADQDDGAIILDSVSYPGNSTVDTSVLPGRYHYYGYYVKTSSSPDTWVRAAVTGCLMLADYGSSAQMIDLIPSFYVNAIEGTDELQADPEGNLFLNLFMSVFGWGLDYLRTQYDTYLNVNNPWTIPVNNLYNLASQLGMDINPDIHPYTLRKAVYFNAAINQQRGTVTGMQAEISALTGYAVNLTTGPNLLLNNDQSFFSAPSYLPWSATLSYNVGEKVSFGNYNYQCIATGNYGNAPTGSSGSNTWWQAILSAVDSTTLLNSLTGGISTWEVIQASNINTALPAGSVFELDGVVDPVNSSNFKFNCIRAKVPNAVTTDLWMRSVSRTTAEVTATQVPDKYQVIADGIPVPYLLTSAPSWSHSVMYNPGDIVTYANQPFRATRASLNSFPPYNNTGNSSQDWQPLGFDQRFRFCVSAFLAASASAPVTPFVEWYDSSGNFIIRIFARNPGTTTSVPNGVVFDSFITNTNSAISGRITDDTQNTWTAKTGSFSTSPYNAGCAYPTVEATRSIETISTGQANCQVGLTFTTAPNAGWSTGLCLRYVSNTSYLRADMSTLKQNNGGTITTLGTYSSPFVAGDRMMVQLNGSNITVLKNNVSVLSVSSSFNSTSTVHGIISETT